jgi:hypothetical protein
VFAHPPGAKNMRRQIIIAALLAAVATGPALAQDGRGHGGGDRGGAGGGGQRGGGGGWGDGQRGQAPQQAAPAPQVQAAPQQAPQVQAQRPQGQYQRPSGQQLNGQVGGRPGFNPAQIQGQGQFQRPQGQWNGQGRGGVFQHLQQQQQQRDEGARNRQQDRNNPNWQQGNRGNDPRFQNGNGRNDPRFGNRFGNNDNRNGQWRGGGHGVQQSWNRDWRRDQRYNWQSYRSANRSFYRLPRYESPYGYGYGYQRFGIGVYLDSQLFGQNYWIDDPYEYRLPEAYPPYHWVRYYNDALLVDEETGYVVDTIYDIFD